MSSQSLLGLPSVSAPLKPITPFLQRANELRNQDFIMTYWCAFHAAQLGISLNAKDEASREVLFSLIGFLEGLKKEIGPSEAVDDQFVSAAYVENFALKVFTMADNEDRAGSATRGTAKKFLASAHFLELLKNFPKVGVPESTDEKIKYAKWKAADIAKAFREGRKPTPGPVGSGVDEDLQATAPESSPVHINNTPIDTDGSFARSPRSAVSQPQTPPRFTGAHLDVGSSSWGVGNSELTPGSWSTVATPGTALTPQEPQEHWDDQASPAEGPTNFANLDDRVSLGNVDAEERPLKKAWVSEDLEPHEGSLYNSKGKSPVTPNDEISKTPVHLDSAPISAGPSDSSFIDYSVPSPGVKQSQPNVRAVGYDSTSVYSASHIPQAIRSSNEQPSESENTITYQGGDDSYRHSFAPSLSTPQPLPRPPVPITIELTPSVIAKAQKHCRFALSSLDYEDADQAKKELRAALALLGG